MQNNFYSFMGLNQDIKLKIIRKMFMVIEHFIALKIKYEIKNKNILYV